MLAAAVAMLLTVQSPLVTPDFGVQVTIFALVGVVVGGLDRLSTASLGGFTIGFATSLVGDELPSSSSQYLPSVIYGLVILVFIARPSGLFAGRAPPWRNEYEGGASTPSSRCSPRSGWCSRSRRSAPSSARSASSSSATRW